MIIFKLSYDFKINSFLNLAFSLNYLLYNSISSFSFFSCSLNSLSSSNYFFFCSLSNLSFSSFYLTLSSFSLLLILSYSIFILLSFIIWYLYFSAYSSDVISLFSNSCFYSYSISYILLYTSFLYSFLTLSCSFFSYSSFSFI